MDRNREGQASHKSHRIRRKKRADRNINARVFGIFWKCARIGERLSPYVSLCCVVMAVGYLSRLPFENVKQGMICMDAKTKGFLGFVDG